MRRRASVSLLKVALVFLLVRATPVVAGTLPPRLTDEQFWALSTSLSEPDGQFHSDNFASNEVALQLVLPQLRERAGKGGVYIGVGPEQNFTYIAALSPPVAFVLDIRRQNLLEHLLYKALFELSADRTEFIARLFSRPVPVAVVREAPVDALLGQFSRTTPDQDLFQVNVAAVRAHLTVHHHFPLSAEDLSRIDFIYSQFFTSGPDLRYSFPGASPRVLELYPSYADLMTATDPEGQRRSFLASGALFEQVRQLQLRNLIVPVVGDFAGQKALRAIGRYAREHEATVGAFYTSNVEQYLFQSADSWKAFYDNVASLPLDARSMLVRSVATTSYPPVSATRLSEPQLVPILDLLASVSDGRVKTYADAVGRH